jgi:hypothetical protein
MKPHNLYAHYIHPENGHDSDIENCKAILTLYKFYEIDTLEIGQSYSYNYLTLKGIPSVTFNPVNFDFYEIDERGDIKVDIFSDPKYNPYLKIFKKRGAKKDTKRCTEESTDCRATTITRPPQNIGEIEELKPRL